VRIKRAIVSVSDRANLSEFTSFLKESGVELFSTGGTKKYLEAIGINPVEVSAYTGFPEIMDGRVKTLHPRVHGGILSIRDNQEHVKAMESHGIKTIDMIVVNLYPFREVVAKGCTFEQAIENIDIGGPSMVRGAAKNYRYVTVVVDPADYGRVMEEMRAHKGDTTEALRFELAKKVFRLISNYDEAIYDYLSKVKGQKVPL
jgi:phosphoribosylaminoimidazolecarboxamide formyltransferase / IMP cyclohydrolase